MRDALVTPECDELEVLELDAERQRHLGVANRSVRRRDVRTRSVELSLRDGRGHHQSWCGKRHFLSFYCGQDANLVVAERYSACRVSRGCSIGRRGG